MDPFCGNLILHLSVEDLRRASLRNFFDKEEIGLCHWNLLHDVPK